MQFDQIIGEHNPKDIAEAEAKLTRVFLELGSGTGNTLSGTKLGGDALAFALLVPSIHIATDKVPTAGTNGRQFFWSPRFIANKSLLGIRLICYHEMTHALYMHPNRIGRRHKNLWNVAVDFITNGLVMEDLTIRLKSKVKAEKSFIEGMGNFATLPQTISMFQNGPNAHYDFMDSWKLEPADPISGEQRKVKYFYADPNLTEDQKRPEIIYSLLHDSLSKCPDCGRLGVYPEEKKNDKQESKVLPNNTLAPDQHNRNNNVANDAGAFPSTNKPNDKDGNGAGDQGIGSSSGSSDKSEAVGSSGKGKCGTCGDLPSILDFGDLIDEHMESVEEEDEMLQRVNNAVETAKAMAGNISSGLTAELGRLSAPKISFPDVLRMQLNKSRKGNSKNNWSSFKTRPMSFGLLIPKKIGSVARFICLLDTSASMTAEQKSLGLSQIRSLDERSEGVVLCCDAKCYWDQATKIRNCSVSELSQIKSIGSGGTILNSFFTDYEKKLGRFDMAIIITDGVFSKTDEEKFIDPGIPVFWLLNGGSKFEPKFGRKFVLGEY